jgi:hypothetical protein
LRNERELRYNLHKDKFMSEGIVSILGDIWQILHQALSDPALQGIGTIISIAGSGIAILTRKSSIDQRHTHSATTAHLKKTYQGRHELYVKRGLALKKNLSCRIGRGSPRGIVTQPG